MSADESIDASDSSEYVIGGDSDKPGLVPLFESSPHEVAAAIGAGAGVIGIGTLGLEIMFSWMTRSEPVGYLAGIGFPFVSAPLGLSPMIIGALLLYSKRRVAPIPLAVGVLYWGLVFVMWP